MTQTPPCSRCGFDIETAKSVKSTQHMLFVQTTKLSHANDPQSARVPDGAPHWVCGHCHAPKEEILKLVKGPSKS